MKEPRNAGYEISSIHRHAWLIQQRRHDIDMSSLLL
jgi:hypothetical protein